jgi:hypothetical protein
MASSSLLDASSMKSSSVQQIRLRSPIHEYTRSPYDNEPESDHKKRKHLFMTNLSDAEVQEKALLTATVPASFAFFSFSPVHQSGAVLGRTCIGYVVVCPYSGRDTMMEPRYFGILGGSLHVFSLWQATLVSGCRPSKCYSTDHFVGSLCHRFSLFYRRYRPFGACCTRNDFVFLAVSLYFGTRPLCCLTLPACCLLRYLCPAS